MFLLFGLLLLGALAIYLYRAAGEARQRARQSAQLESLVRANLGRAAEVIESEIVTAVYDFMGEAMQQDDITLMVVVGSVN